MKKRSSLSLLMLLSLLAAMAWAGRSTLMAQDQEPGNEIPLNPVMEAMLENPVTPENLEPMGAIPCVGGMAGIYPCENVDLLAFLPIATIGGGIGSDAWGWTDPLDGKEYAISTRSNGTAFVDISDPENPIYLGNLPSHTGTATWRDAKVYSNHAYIVSDGNGNHGMQIFDLTQLRNVVSPPVTFAETQHYGQFGSAHNIVINEDSGYAYAVGVSSGTTTCSGGLHMINIQNPTSPVFAGCYSASGYTHDAQCVMYQGPDPDHQGDEICINSNGNSGLYVVDVTDKGNPTQLSFTSYTGQDYTHQGWLTDDHRYFLLDDELDELSFGHNTRTRIFDVSNLDAPPVLIDFYDAPVPATDHNLYIHNGFAFEANYQSGMRILDTSDVANGNLTEAGYFDVYVANNNAGFGGAWTAFPYFDSGVVIINGREQGLFIVEPVLFTDTGTLEGQITNADNGQPINSAKVKADSGSYIRSAFTDSSGDYALTLPPGTYDVTVTANGYSPQTVTGLTVLTNTVTTQNFSLDPAAGTLERSEDTIEETVMMGDSVTRTLVVSNTGPAPFDFTVSEGSAWVEVTPSGGTLNPGEAMPLSIVFDSSATAGAGTYNGTLSFSGTYGNNPADVNLILHVTVETYYTYIPVMRGDGGAAAALPSPGTPVGVLPWLVPIIGLAAVAGLHRKQRNGVVER